LALLQVTRRKGGTNIRHHKKNGYAPKQNKTKQNKTKQKKGPPQPDVAATRG
jgi:hypothetical protein